MLSYSDHRREDRFRTENALQKESQPKTHQNEKEEFLRLS